MRKDGRKSERGTILKIVERRAMNRKTFTGPTRTDVLEVATRWWASQDGFRQVGRWEISAGHDTSPQHAQQWAVTIIYEDDPATTVSIRNQT
jgi:hypothetical protein